ncbi:helix-turn-helix transcriptional regulator [Kineococcus endophyticus]|uniref:Helix-turn-helix transcriptional regulator n=1 Tax=Kineococcus endophyticus TaxID=1181883 RepID=A0ABV3P162_9ACTN
MPTVTFTTGAQVGRWLHGLRRQAGLTQTQLSQRTGVSQRYISELERGKSDLTLSRLLLLTEALGATLSGSGPAEGPS